jgi:hypothetical protein
MDFYIFAEIPLPSLFLHWHAYFQLSTNYIIQNLAMDELYWDIFRAEHETWTTSSSVKPKNCSHNVPAADPMPPIHAAFGANSYLSSPVVN